MIVWAVVLAAGSGERFGEPEGLPKVLRPLGGIPMYLRALQAFDGHPGIAGSVLVFPAIWEGQMLEELVDQVAGPVYLIAGGSSRAASVRAGLAEVPADADAVLVHDAARPLVGADVIDRVLAGLAEYDAVVPALDVTDTIKRAHDGVVVETLERAGLVAVQTPQGFSARALREAHATEPDDATDDAMVVERAGGRVAIVDGDERNIKVTRRSDLELAEDLLRRVTP